MNFTSLIKAKKVLNPLWKRAWLKGRCWGTKTEHGLENPYFGSNITLAINNELVSISQDPDSSLRIHEFSKTEETALGKAIKDILKKNNLKIKGG